MTALLRSHPRAAGLGLAGWLALWTLTVLTWIYDEAGYSASMHPLPSLLHLAAPFIVGGLIGWWAQPRAALLAGAAFAAFNFAALLIWSAALIAAGRVSPGPDVMPAWSGLGEALGMGFIYVLWGGVTGLAGGWLARAFHLFRGRLAARP